MIKEVMNANHRAERSTIFQVVGTYGDAFSARVVMALAVLAGSVAASGCRTETASGEADSREKQLGFSVSVLQVKSCESADSHASQNRPELGVELDLTNLSEEPLPANFYYARLLDEKEREIRPHFGGCRPRLAHSPLSQGQRARGWVSFRVPDDATGLRIVYAPSFGQTVKRSEPISLMR